MKVSIVIAVYNEAGTVRALLDRVLQQPLFEMQKELLIVESNSTDGSRAIVEEFVRDHPQSADATVRPIYQAGPRGKGNAVREGLTQATGDIVIIQDADLEYDVADYPALLQPIVEGRTAFVLGSRHMGSNRWKIRKFGRASVTAAFMNFGGMVFHAFFNLTFNSKLTDPTSMYKVFRRDCLRNLRFVCDGFDFDFELLGKLIRAGFKPLEVPVSYASRGFDEGKKIRILRDPPTWVIAILKTRFGALSSKSDAAETSAAVPQLSVVDRK